MKHILYLVLFLLISVSYNGTESYSPNPVLQTMKYLKELSQEPFALHEAGFFFNPLLEGCHSSHSSQSWHRSHRSHYSSR